MKWLSWLLSKDSGANKHRAESMAQRAKDKETRSIAVRVREAAKALGEFCSRDLVYADYSCYITPKQVRNALRDFEKAGEVERIEGRRYRFIGKDKVRTKLDIIWHLVRSHRYFSTDEMERLSGAARTTVLEYLQCLRKLGYIRQVRRGHWQLINDPGPETPVNTAKCARLKRSRDRKKEDPS